MNSRSYIKNWVGTLNNYTEDDVQRLNELKVILDYWVIGKETGESGTPHLQFYISLKKGERLSALSKRLPRAFLEIMRGTPKQASDYCKKDGDFTEGGTLPKGKAGAGREGGLVMSERYKTALNLAKKRQFDEIEPSMLIKHYHSLKKIAQDNPVSVPDAQSTTGHWFHGPPRTGKSATARYENPGFYDKPCNKWWDGYMGQESVIIDDLDLNHRVLGHHIKRWTDRYSFPAEEKGTTLQIRPRKVVITSNYTPEEIWSDDPTLAAAVRARCHFRSFNEHSFNPALFLPRDAQSIPVASLTELYCSSPEPTQVIRPEACGYMSDDSVDIRHDPNDF